MNTQKLQTPSSTKDSLELMSFFVCEFRSQMKSIVAYANLLNDELDFKNDDPKAKILHNIVSGVYDIQEQLKRLIELAKLETSGFQLDVEAVDINSIISTVLNKLSPIIHLKNQTISTELTSQLPNINGDPLRIEQILMNLLSNASRSSPDGGHMTLTVERRDEYMSIRIQDSGPAIPVEMHRYILQPFNNLINCNKNCIKADLNLALCKHYVELHGGKIQIENSDNMGNTFSIILPLS